MNDYNKFILENGNCDKLRGPKNSRDRREG